MQDDNIVIFRCKFFLVTLLSMWMRSYSTVIDNIQEIEVFNWAQYVFWIYVLHNLLNIERDEMIVK